MLVAVLWNHVAVALAMSLTLSFGGAYVAMLLNYGHPDGIVAVFFYGVLVHAMIFVILYLLWVVPALFNLAVYSMGFRSTRAKTQLPSVQSLTLPILLPSRLLCRSVCAAIALYTVNVVGLFVFGGVAPQMEVAIRLADDYAVSFVVLITVVVLLRYSRWVLLRDGIPQ